MKAALKLGCLVAAFVLVCVGGEVARAGVELVSVGVAGAPANGESYSDGAPSANGRFVVFNSLAFNLVPSDTNGQQDVFVRDRKNHTTRMASLGRKGVQGDGFSGGGAISADGQLVVFQSQASNLVPGDTNGVSDVFLRDLRAGTTQRISVATGGKQANGASYLPSISANNRYVVFMSAATNLVPHDTNGKDDVFLYDRQKKATFRVSLGAAFAQANRHSPRAAVSHDARFVAFQSTASNLVPGDTNGVEDVFTVVRSSGIIRRASVGNGGQQGTMKSFQQTFFSKRPRRK
jgi:Tol biopolymer transport system component